MLGATLFTAAVGPSFGHFYARGLTFTLGLKIRVYGVAASGLLGYALAAADCSDHKPLCGIEGIVTGVGFAAASFALGTVVDIATAHVAARDVNIAARKRWHLAPLLQQSNTGGMVSGLSLGGKF